MCMLLPATHHHYFSAEASACESVSLCERGCCEIVLLLKTGWVRMGSQWSKVTLARLSWTQSQSFTIKAIAHFDMNITIAYVLPASHIPALSASCSECTLNETLPRGICACLLRIYLSLISQLWSEASTTCSTGPSMQPLNADTVASSEKLSLLEQRFGQQ